MFQVKVTIANPGDPARAFEEPFWVDTRALYSFAPEDRLHAIGIQPRSVPLLVISRIDENGASATR